MYKLGCSRKLYLASLDENTASLRSIVKVLYCKGVSLTYTMCAEQHQLCRYSISQMLLLSLVGNFQDTEWEVGWMGAHGNHTFIFCSGGLSCKASSWS